METFSMPCPDCEQQITFTRLPDLPYGWEQVTDPHHGTYYIDHTTRRTQYEKPQSEIIGQKLNSVETTQNPAIKLDTRTVSLIKATGGFGFTIVGDESRSPWLQVNTIHPNSPAAAAGTLARGDILLSVDGKSLYGASPQQLVAIFRDIPVNQLVTMEISRGHALYVHTDSNDDVDVISAVTPSLPSSSIATQPLSIVTSSSSQLPPISEQSSPAQSDVSVKMMPSSKCNDVTTAPQDHLPDVCAGVHKPAASKSRDNSGSPDWPEKIDSLPVFVENDVIVASPVTTSTEQRRRRQGSCSSRSSSSSSSSTPLSHRLRHNSVEIPSSHHPIQCSSSYSMYQLQAQGFHGFHENPAALSVSNVSSSGGAWDTSMTAAILPQLAGHVPSNVNDLHEFSLTICPGDAGFGLRIVGGIEGDTQVTVGEVLVGGAAERDGRVRCGDRILCVDGASVIGASHHLAVEMMKRAASLGTVTLLIHRPPPDSLDFRFNALNNLNPQQFWPDQGSLLKQEAEIFELVLCRGPRGYGLSVRGGREFGNMPLTVLHLVPGGVAHRSGLIRVGDYFISINGLSAACMRHADAVALIQSSVRLRLMLKRPSPLLHLHPALDSTSSFGYHHQQQQQQQQQQQAIGLTRYYSIQ